MEMKTTPYAEVGEPQYTLEDLKDLYGDQTKFRMLDVEMHWGIGFVLHQMIDGETTEGKVDRMLAKLNQPTPEEITKMVDGRWHNMLKLALPMGVVPPSTPEKEKLAEMVVASGEKYAGEEAQITSWIFRNAAVHHVEAKGVLVSFYVPESGTTLRDAILQTIAKEQNAQNPGDSV